MYCTIIPFPPVKRKKLRSVGEEGTCVLRNVRTLSRRRLIVFWNDERLIIPTLQWKKGPCTHGKKKRLCQNSCSDASWGEDVVCVYVLHVCTVHTYPYMWTIYLCTYVLYRLYHRSLPPGKSLPSGGEVATTKIFPVLSRDNWKKKKFGLSPTMADMWTTSK